MVSNMLRDNGFEIISTINIKGMEHFACKKI